MKYTCQIAAIETLQLFRWIMMGGFHMHSLDSGDLKTR